MTRKQEFSYDLPEDLIAQYPLEQRDHSRLLVLPSKQDSCIHSEFFRLPDYVKPGDTLVINNTRVIPARLMGIKADSGIAVEFLLLRRIETDQWEVMVRPGRRVRTGHRIEFIPNRLSARVLEVMPGGNRRVEFDYQGIWEERLEEAGSMPLPPYITEQLEDRERYQTIYARHEGSAAAPTAGLHFTPQLLDELRNKGVSIAELTLHVGLGTFRPVKADQIEDHVMHAEYFELPDASVRLIENSRKHGGRIIAVGTTSCRVLEAVAGHFNGRLRPHSGWTDIFIYPGYEFQVIDGLITNFHLPESTLLMLVSALAGRERILQAYREAIKERYRFFSFGDAMLIWK